MKLTEHEMLVTLATMALKMDDITGHDVIEALRAHGYGAVLNEDRVLSEDTIEMVAHNLLGEEIRAGDYVFVARNAMEPGDGLLVIRIEPRARPGSHLVVVKDPINSISGEVIYLDTSVRRDFSQTRKEVP